MYRMTSQLCEAFRCTDRELDESGLLDEFNAWLKRHPALKVCHDIRYGEAINGDIAGKFLEFYKARKAN
jgi:hypothetical protein